MAKNRLTTGQDSQVHHRGNSTLQGTAFYININQILYIIAYDDHCKYFNVFLWWLELFQVEQIACASATVTVEPIKHSF